MAGEWGWMGGWHDLAKINCPQLVLLSTAIVLGIRKTLVSNPFFVFYCLSTWFSNSFKYTGASFILNDLSSRNLFLETNE